MHTTKALNRSATDAVAAHYGLRWCQSCARERKVEGGLFTTTRQGRRMWRCMTCAMRSAMVRESAEMA